MTQACAGQPAATTSAPQRQPAMRWACSIATGLRWRNAAFAAAMALPLVLALLGSAHAPFTNDEPKLIAAAAEANTHWRLAAVGLPGTYGAPYGPIPTQIYQLLLIISGGTLASLPAIHAAVFLGATAIGLLCFAAELKLPRWVVPVLLLSPLLITESFHLWDNTFNIPFSILTLWAYARFIRTGTSASAAACAVGSLLMLSTHLTAAPLVAAIGADALWNHRAGLWRCRYAIGTAVLFVALLHYGYPQRLLTAKLHAPQPYVADPSQPVAVIHANEQIPLLPPLPSRAGAMLFGLSGPLVLAGFQALLDPKLLDGTLGSLASIGQDVSWLMLLLAAVGAVVIIRQWFAGEASNNASDQIVTPLDVRRSIGRIALTAVALQAVYFGALRAPRGYHYFNGTWAAAVTLVWVGIERIRPRLAMAGVVGLLAVGSLTVDTACLNHLSRSAGSRLLPGPDLSEQIAAVHTAISHGTSVYTNVPALLAFPHALQTVALFDTTPTVPHNTSTDGGSAPLVAVIEFSSPSHDSARLAVRLAAAGSLDQAEYAKIDLFRPDGRLYY